MSSSGSEMDGISRGKSKKRQRIESDDEGTDKAVLPVATFDETFTETSSPTTGEQYLALVQVERKKFPGTVIAEHIHEQSLGVGDLLPDMDSTSIGVKRARVDVIMESFEADRGDVKKEGNGLLDAPSDTDRHAWLKYFYGIDHSNFERVEGEHSSVEDILSNISDEMAMQLLSFHNAWLEDINPEMISFDAIYKLLTIIDTKLTPSQVDKLRSLARHCIRLLDSETIPEMSTKLEEIVVIVAMAFGQKDLVRIVIK